jgi:hypothetical protein
MYWLVRPVEQAGAWLFRVAKNRITDLFRKTKTEAHGARAEFGPEGRSGGVAALGGDGTGGCVRRAACCSTSSLSFHTASGHKETVATFWFGGARFRVSPGDLADRAAASRRVW